VCRGKDVLVSCASGVETPCADPNPVCVAWEGGRAACVTDPVTECSVEDDPECEGDVLVACTTELPYLVAVDCATVGAECSDANEAGRNDCISTAPYVE
jgi:hypothetical protein